MRMALQFAKRDGAAYISHLDLQRAFSRAIRRSGLPVKLSQGFNPHYVVSFASALALGVPSECECVEMQLAEEISPGEFLQAMGDALPPGLAALHAVRLKDHAPKLMAALDEAEYTVEIRNTDIAAVEAVLQDIMASEAVVVSRVVKGVEKKIDIRPMILSLSLTGSVLVMRLSASQEKSLRPDAMVNELKRRAGDFDCTITRTGLFTFASGSTQPLLDTFAV